MKQIKASDLVELSLQERIQLVEDIWDSIVAVPESIEIPAWHKLELERSLEAYHQDQNNGSPWKDVKQRILN